MAQKGKKDSATDTAPARKGLGILEPIPLVSDQPIHTASHFHFNALADALVGMLARAGNPTPFVILVDGRWGSGKTTLMKTVIRSLAPAITPELLETAGRKAGDKNYLDLMASPLHAAPLVALSSWVDKAAPERTGSHPEKEAKDFVEWFENTALSSFAESGGQKIETEKIASFYNAYRPVRCVFFNAWKYKNESEIFPALAHELLSAMRNDGWLARFQAVTQEVGNAEWRDAIAKLAQAVPVAGGALSVLVNRPEWLKDVALYDQARPYIQALATTWATTYALRADSIPPQLKAMLFDDVRNVGRHLKELRGSFDQTHMNLRGILAIFIDDLDRCPRDHIKEVLKAINLLVDLDSCAFVLGADRERVADAVGAAYGEDNKKTPEADYGNQFLGKIVQLHLVLPEAGSDEMGAYLDEILAGLGAAGDSQTGESQTLATLIQRHRDLLVIGLPPNPREAKQFLNQAMVRLYLLKRLCAEKEQAFESKEATTLLKYLLTAFQLPRLLWRDQDFLLRLQKVAPKLPTIGRLGEQGIGGEGRDKEGSLREQIHACMSDPKGKAAMELVDEPTWQRIIAVLCWKKNDEEGIVELNTKSLKIFATFGVPARSTSSPDKADSEEIRELVRKREEEDRQEKERARQTRKRGATLAEEFVDVLVGEIGKNVELGEALQTTLRKTQIEWGSEVREALSDVLLDKVRNQQDLLKVADDAQRVLIRALDDPASAKRGDALTFAIALRDGVYDRVQVPDDTQIPEEWREDSVWQPFLEKSGIKADPWALRWWGEEREALITQMPLGLKSESEDWLPVPPGPFIAGDVVNNRELPVRIEHIRQPFFIARHPVLVRDFREFVGENGYNFDHECWAPFAGRLGSIEHRSRRPSRWDERKENLNHPVTGVSWFEAMAYCRWRNQQESGRCDGPYRLPSEAEWEKAARGLFGRRWPWGCTWKPALVVCAEEGAASQEKLAEVTANPNLSPFGAQGMAGNVWEWTSTKLQDTGFGEGLRVERELKVISEGDVISLRGGSFYIVQDFTRCAYRYGVVAGYFYDDVGFRCVRDVS